MKLKCLSLFLGLIIMPLGASKTPAADIAEYCNQNTFLLDLQDTAKNPAPARGPGFLDFSMEQDDQQELEQEHAVIQSIQNKTDECYQCGKKFKNRGALTFHQKSCGNEKDGSCSYCGKYFRYKSQCTIHEKTHDKRFSKRALKVQEHDFSVEESDVLPNLGLTYNDVGEALGSTVNLELLCAQNTSTTTPGSCSEKNRLSCIYCNKIFSCCPNRIRHEKTHKTNFYKKATQAQESNKIDAPAVLLEVDITPDDFMLPPDDNVTLTESNTLPEPCPLATVSLSPHNNITYATDHESDSVTEQPDPESYTCPFKNCTASFKNRMALEIHKKKATLHERIAGSNCLEQFKQATKPGQKERYQCPHCIKSFIRLFHFTDHIKENHPNSETAHQILSPASLPSKKTETASPQNTVNDSEEDDASSTMDNELFHFSPEGNV